MRSVMMIVTVLAACGGKQQTQPVTETGTGTETESGNGEMGNGEVETAASEGQMDTPDTEARNEEKPAPAAENPWVAAHNEYRKQHCAPPLTWSPELAKAAQAWADHLRKADCAFEHSRTRYGENLAGGTSGALDPASSVEMWYREVDKYDFKRGGFSMDTGHFTQLVWADTQHVGCGMTTCKGLDIIVCNYDPPGNVEGAYRTNVKPKGCK